MQSNSKRLMSLLFLASFCFAPSIMAQLPENSDSELARRIEASPPLPFLETRLSLYSSFSDWELGAVAGVAIGRSEDIYVIQRGDKADPILVFDKQGKLIRSWGRGDFALPHSLRLDSRGNVWAVDAQASKVIKYDSTGRKLLTIEVSPVPIDGSSFRGITDVAFAPNGNLYITDGYANARILEYTARGKELKEWGHPGKGTGEFELPHGIQIGPDGIVYVADRENGRIEKFNLNGKFMGEIDGLGRCYALKLVQGVLWTSVSPMGEAPGAPGWLLKLDPHTGEILGHARVLDQRQGHALDVSSSGKVLVTAGNGVLSFQRN